MLHLLSCREGKSDRDRDLIFPELSTTFTERVVAGQAGCIIASWAIDWKSLSWCRFKWDFDTPCSRETSIACNTPKVLFGWRAGEISYHSHLLLVPALWETGLLFQEWLYRWWASVSSAGIQLAQSLSQTKGPLNICTMDDRQLSKEKRISC